jgi:hypothetical protein
MTTEALPKLLAIDQEIDCVMSRIRLCARLPSEKRALATTRAHEELRLLEEVRRILVIKVFPEALEGLASTG